MPPLIRKVLVLGLVCTGALGALRAAEAATPSPVTWERLPLPPGGVEKINPEGDRQVFAVQIDAGRGRLYAANRFTGEGGGGLLVSEDDGVNWRPVGPPGQWTLKSGPNDGGFRVHPARPDWFFFGSENRGVFVSHDAGTTWAQTIAGWEEGGIGHGFTFAFDPGDERRVFASGGRGVFRSTDAGRTWRRLDLPETQTNGVAVDPRNGRTVLAAATWKIGHLSRSDDGGDTWVPRMDGIPEGRVTSGGYPLRATWQVVFDPRHEQRVYAATAAGLFRSDDGGAKWRRLYDSGVPGVRQNGMLAIAVSPHDSAILLGAESRGHVLLSRDGGTSWTDITGGLATGRMPHGWFGIRVCDLAFDPRTPEVVYVARTDGLYRARLR